MSWEEAAALPLVLLTAFDQLLEVNPQPSKWCLVQAGGGGVGHIGIQVCVQHAGFLRHDLSLIA
jgi:NADPH:quinone reductase-like Zn-dependent oxidoreductase